MLKIKNISETKMNPDKHSSQPNLFSKNLPEMRFRLSTPNMAAKRDESKSDQTVPHQLKPSRIPIPINKKKHPSIKGDHCNAKLVINPSLMKRSRSFIPVRCASLHRPCQIKSYAYFDHLFPPVDTKRPTLTFDALLSNVGEQDLLENETLNDLESCCFNPNEAEEFIQSTLNTVQHNLHSSGLDVDLIQFSLSNESVDIYLEPHEMGENKIVIASLNEADLLALELKRPKCLNQTYTIQSRSAGIRARPQIHAENSTLKKWHKKNDLTAQSPPLDNNNLLNRGFTQLNRTYDVIKPVVDDLNKTYVIRREQDSFDYLADQLNYVSPINISLTNHGEAISLNVSEELAEPGLDANQLNSTLID